MADIVRCAWCTRVLKHPHWQGFVAYGAVCIKKVEALSEIILFADTQEDPAR